MEKYDGFCNQKMEIVLYCYNFTLFISSDSFLSVVGCMQVLSFVFADCFDFEENASCNDFCVDLVFFLHVFVTNI